MSLIGRCDDCEREGMRLHKKPDVSRDEQTRPSICRGCRDRRQEHMMDTAWGPAEL